VTPQGLGQLGGSAGHGAPGDEGDGLAAGRPNGPGTPEGSPDGASVVVATVGRADRLARIVEAVLAEPATLELVVVVDGVDDRSWTVLQELAAGRPRLRPVAVEHRGQLGALDAGVRLATGQVVVLLDDDVVPAPGTIAGHLAHHRSEPGLVVTGPMPVVPTGASPGVGTRLYAAEYRLHVAAIEDGTRGVLDSLWTGNVSMRRDDCLRIGLASPAFGSHYHADTDLGFRLAVAGMVGRFDPALEAAHLHTRTDRAFLRDAFQQGAGRAELHRVHPERMGPFSPGMLVADLPRALRAAVGAAGNRRVAGPTAAAILTAGRWGARFGRTDLQLAAAKLARRIMQWRGAVAGGAPGTPVMSGPARRAAGSRRS
jgi:GT2 family glycosyltransferase